MREMVIYVNSRPRNCGYFQECPGCPILSGTEQAVLPSNELTSTTYAAALKVIVGEVCALRHMSYVVSDVKALANQPTNQRNVRCQAGEQLGVALGEAAH